MNQNKIVIASCAVTLVTGLGFVSLKLRQAKASAEFQQALDDVRLSADELTLLSKSLRAGMTHANVDYLVCVFNKRVLFHKDFATYSESTISSDGSAQLKIVYDSKTITANSLVVSWEILRPERVPAN